MNKSDKSAKGSESKPTINTSKPHVRIRQHGFGVLELLFAATTLGTTALVAAMSYTKRPPLSGD